MACIESCIDFAVEFRGKCRFGEVHQADSGEQYVCHPQGRAIHPSRMEPRVNI